MKLKFVFIILLSLTSILPANATEPDTIWTQGANQAGYFTPDGTKIIFVVGECVDVSDGHLIWSNDTNFISYPIFTKDSLYYYDYDLSKHRISDGAKVNDGPALKLKTLPPYFAETEAVSNGIGERGILLSADQRYVFSIRSKHYRHCISYKNWREKYTL